MATSCTSLSWQNHGGVKAQVGAICLRTRRMRMVLLSFCILVLASPFPLPPTLLLPQCSVVNEPLGAAAQALASAAAVKV